MRRTFFAALLVAAACNSEPPPTSPTSPAASDSSPVNVPVPDAAPASASASASASAPASASASASAPPGGIPPSSSSPVLVKLERTACLGTCPVYHLALRADGSWLLGGWYPKKGCAWGNVPATEVTKLVAMAKKMGYPALKASYAARVTDLPSANTEVTIDGKTKAVHHDGNSGDPVEKDLNALEKAIDDAIGTDKVIAAGLGPCGPYSPYPNVP